MSNKIDLEYIDIEIYPEHSIQYGTIKNSDINFEIHYDGDVIDFKLNDGYVLMIPVNTLAEIVRITKFFRDRRSYYLNTVE